MCAELYCQCADTDYKVDGMNWQQSMTIKDKLIDAFNRSGTFDWSGTSIESPIEPPIEPPTKPPTEPPTKPIEIPT